MLYTITVTNPETNEEGICFDRHRPIIADRQYCIEKLVKLREWQPHVKYTLNRLVEEIA